MLVKDDLTVPGAQQVFVLGDLASAKTEAGKPIPGVAQPAIQGGKHAARCIIRMLRGEPPVRFHYFDKGSLATIGRAAAVAEVGPLRTEGFFAWLLWLFIHVLYLVGFRNRLAVLGGWAWSYLRSERGARLITGEVGALIPPLVSLEPATSAAPKVTVP
ncbi:MAG: hypothetical protein NVS2B9_18140 [Myxococcales bacterium]